MGKSAIRWRRIRARRRSGSRDPPCRPPPLNEGFALVLRDCEHDSQLQEIATLTIEVNEEPLPPRRWISGTCIRDVAYIGCRSLRDGQHHVVSVFSPAMEDLNGPLVKAVAAALRADESFIADHYGHDRPPGMAESRFAGGHAALPTSSCTAASAACWKRSRAARSGVSITGAYRTLPVVGSFRTCPSRSICARPGRPIQSRPSFWCSVQSRNTMPLGSRVRVTNPCKVFRDIGRQSDALIMAARPCRHPAR